jgi:C-terminal processing protease CtpA/Prc
MIGDQCYVVAVRPQSDAQAQGLKEGDLIHLYDGMKPNRREFWKIQYLLNVLRPKAGLQMVVQSSGGEPRQLEIKARVEQLKRLTDLTDANEIMKLAIDEERDARLTRHRYVELGQEVFVWKMPQFDLPKEKVDEMTNKFRNNKTVIIDLRGNGGGYEDTLLRLIGSFFDKDVKVGDITRRKESKPLIAKGVDRPYTGQLVVLIDSDSGSSAELFARVMQLEKRGVVIGDQSAGAVMRARHYPHVSGMGIGTFYGASITDADILMTDQKSLEHVGVTPDELILPTQSDLAAGRDPVLTRAFAIAGIQMPPEKARGMFPKEWRKIP